MNLAYFQRNVRLLIEGIQIKDFSKLSNDPEFIEACKLYASMIKNDNDAKTKFNLYDLDKYKQNLQGFIEQVQKAYQYINGQRQFNKLLKKPLPKGVNLVYKDKNCLIVSPETYMNSHDAAYLDGASATWCVASPGKEAQPYWDTYKAIVIFYIYFPDMSYALVIPHMDFKKIIDKKFFVFTFGDEAEFSSQIEDRKNNSHEDPAKQKELLNQLENRLPNINKILAQYILQNQNNNGIINRLRYYDNEKLLENIEKKLFATTDVRYIEEYVKVVGDKNNIKDSRIHFWLNGLYYRCMINDNQKYSSIEKIDKFKNIFLYCLKNFKDGCKFSTILTKTLYDLKNSKHINLDNFKDFANFLIELYLKDILFFQKEIFNIIIEYLESINTKNTETYDAIIEYIFFKTYKEINYEDVFINSPIYNIDDAIINIHNISDNKIKKYFINEIIYDIAKNAYKIFYNNIKTRIEYYKNYMPDADEQEYIDDHYMSLEEYRLELLEEYLNRFENVYEALIELYKSDDHLVTKLKMELTKFKNINPKEFL